MKRNTTYIMSDTKYGVINMAFSLITSLQISPNKMKAGVVVYSKTEVNRRVYRYPSWLTKTNIRYAQTVVTQ